MDYINPTTEKGWSPREEEIIERIMATETEVEWERTIPCSRIEAIRRMRRRKLDDLQGNIQDREPVRMSSRSMKTFITWPEETPPPPRVKPNVYRPSKIILINRSASGPVREEQKKLDPLSTREIREISIPPAHRRSLSEDEKSKIINRQSFKCIYCARKLGSTVWDPEGKPVILSTRFDHFEPFALRSNENPENFVAACGVCNGFKSDKVFDSLKDARTWLAGQWELKGYQDSFPGMRRFQIDLKLLDVGGWTGMGNHLQDIKKRPELTNEVFSHAA
jgi:hypothetical protein